MAPGKSKNISRIDTSTRRSKETSARVSSSRQYTRKKKRKRKASPSRWQQLLYVVAAAIAVYIIGGNQTPTDTNVPFSATPTPVFLQTTPAAMPISTPTPTPTPTPIPTLTPISTPYITVPTATLTTSPATPKPAAIATPTPIITYTPKPLPTPTVAPEYTLLRSGAKGDQVKAIQERLIVLGFLPTGSADGDYGNATRNAIILFQRQHNLDADGIAGKVTQELLFSSAALGSSQNTESVQLPQTVAAETESRTSPAATISMEYTLLRSGDRGAQVRALQERLISLGYLYSGSADGDYGNTTRKAVLMFQQQNGLDADGIAGAKTQELLFSSSAKYNSQSPATVEKTVKSSSSSGSSSSGGTVYYTSNGECYHYSSKCSRMKNPKSTTLSNAKSYGLRPCSKCT